MEKPCAEKAFAPVESPFFGSRTANTTHALFQGLVSYLARIGRKREAGLTGRPNEANLQLLWNPNSRRSKSQRPAPASENLYLVFLLFHQILPAFFRPDAWLINTCTRIDTSNTVGQ
jgi:hypothetical protein